MPFIAKHGFEHISQPNIKTCSFPLLHYSLSVIVPCASKSLFPFRCSKLCSVPPSGVPD